MLQHGLSNLEYQHPRCECHECVQARWRMSVGSLGSTVIDAIPGSQEKQDKLNADAYAKLRGQNG